MSRRRLRLSARPTTDSCTEIVPRTPGRQRRRNKRHGVHFLDNLAKVEEFVMAESTQHKLDRVRRPRVQITYDVETNGAMQKTELPFVVGVLADLSGYPKSPQKALKDRKAVSVDRDNFNDVLAKATPRVAFRVPNKLIEEENKLLGV